LDFHVSVSEFGGKVKWVQIDIGAVAKDVSNDWSGGAVPFRSRQWPVVTVSGFARQAGNECDGSTDTYLGPNAPVGKQGNWLASVPGKGYFAILRLYGPTEAAINKSWKPGDIEKVK
jgi:hypothetical protein